LATSADVLATASWSAGEADERPARQVPPAPQDWTPSDAAEAAADVALSLANRLATDQGSVTAIGLQGFGQWREDLVDGRSFTPHCDTARLSRLTGLTVVDDFPGRDLAHEGRGGPCEAVGFWLLLADRGTIPGRRIRALLDLDDMVRLVLLPPRQTGQLPPHLLAYDVAPGTRLLTTLTNRLLDDRAASDLQGKMAVQGRVLDPLLQKWLETLPPQPVSWRPDGDPLEPLCQVLDEHLLNLAAPKVCEIPRSAATRRTPADGVGRWTAQPSIGDHAGSLQDILCTAVHLIARRVTQLVKDHLPRSQPVGQLVLSGPLRGNGLFVSEIRRQLPEIELSSLDAWGIPSPARWAAATGLLAQLMIDQIPANGPGLTGAQWPRILGRITPGSPANWHQVLVDMAATLPIKMPLRDAV
jgi:anhydro-N-acetylmuramic acid kinase